MLNGNELPLERCPHCSAAKPRIARIGYLDTTASERRNTRYWHWYGCASCGGVLLTVATPSSPTVITKMWSDGDLLSDSIPERARAFLKQAMECLHAPPLAQIGAASAVDAMLKARGYTDAALKVKGHKDPKLFTRIKAAEADYLITPEMAEWAHEVRLDANDQRHADEAAPLPTKDEAEKTIEFAKALAEFLFVLPAMVSRGRRKPENQTEVVTSN
jgi:hypothetical protein